MRILVVGDRHWHCAELAEQIVSRLLALEAKHGRLSRQFDNALDLCEVCGELLGLGCAMAARGRQMAWERRQWTRSGT